MVAYKFFTEENRMPVFDNDERMVICKGIYIGDEPDTDPATVVVPKPSARVVDDVPEDLFGLAHDPHSVDDWGGART